MADIFFKGADHKQRFLAAMKDNGKIYGGKLDPEYAAGFYVLTADLSTWVRASDYVTREGIDFSELLEEVDFSGGYRVLIQWAANLFNEYAANINPVELMRLDDSNFRVALTALLLRRTSYPLDSFK